MSVCVLATLGEEWRTAGAGHGVSPDNTPSTSSLSYGFLFSSFLTQKPRKWWIKPDLQWSLIIILVAVIPLMLTVNRRGLARAAPDNQMNSHWRSSPASPEVDDVFSKSWRRFKCL